MCLLIVWLFTHFKFIGEKEHRELVNYIAQNMSQSERWPGEVSKDGKWSKWAQTLQGHGIYLTRMSK